MQYVGARYVPKFMDTYDPTTTYENMCVVDNGMGTSYISKKPVPAGTPLTDTEYWAIYGASNGAIINLQNQIDDINDDIQEMSTYYTPEMFGAVGDGVTDDTAAVQEALDQHGTVICKNKYLITSPLYIPAFTTLRGDAAAYEGNLPNGSAIIAATTFVGDFMLIGVPYEYSPTFKVCRSISVMDLSLECSNVTGGFKAVALYDACRFVNLNIVNVASNKRGFYSPCEGITSQTVLMENVFVQHSNTSPNTDYSIALIHLDRWQECTLINVKAITYKGVAFGIYGCRGLVLQMCAAGDYALSDSIGYSIKNFGADDIIPQSPKNIKMISCLNENCATAIDALSYVLSLTGTFTDYTAGTKITQGASVGYVASGNASQLYVIMTTGTLTAGTCSAGTISTVAPLLADDLHINDFDSLTSQANSTQTVHIEGFTHSSISINRFTGSNVKTNINATNNTYTDIKYDARTVGTITTDGLTNISPNCNYILNANTSNSSVRITDYITEGGKAIVKSNSTAYNVRCYLGTNEFGTDSVYLSYFTEAIFEVKNGIWYLTSIDGYAYYGNKALKTGSPVIKEVSGSFQYDNFDNNKHYINSGASNDIAINVSAIYNHGEFTVTAIDYNVTVNITGAFTFADGTTSKTVAAGNTQHFFRAENILIID